MMRRLLDLLVAVVFLILTAPLQIVLAILIKCNSRGPIFYIPKMVGEHIELFPLFRFRTMTVDESQHLSGDERLTQVGRVLRAYSLDHLPMILNVLLGHLTLVGPRPMEMEVVDTRDAVWQTYFRVKSGVFNYAVLKLGRAWTPSRTQAPALNQDLELRYLQRRSWVSDSALMCKCVYALIVNKGNVKVWKAPDADLSC